MRSVRSVRSVRAVLAASAAVLVSAAATPQAFAAELVVENMTGISSRSCDVYADGGPAGDACFRKYGDYFYIFGYDTNTRLAVHWRTADGSRRGLIRWQPTAQFTKGVKNKNFDENTVIEFRFGVCKPGSGCNTLSDVNWQTGFRRTSTT